MKSLITSFIMTLITILMVIILGVFGLIIYEEVTKTNITEEVQEFVSNIVITAEDTTKKVESSQIVDSTINNLEKTEINYNNVSVDKYFYNQLENYSKTIYKAMEKNKENMKTGTYEIDLGTEFSEILSQDNGQELLGDYYQSAIEAYTYDNPEVFYIDFGKLYLNIETTTRGFKKTYKVFINSGTEENYLTNEFKSKENIDVAINELEKVKQYFIVNKKDDTYSNIKLVHDYLIESIEYDQSLSKDNIYDIYGALVNKQSVCEGYAKAFKYLVDGLDIPCVMVSGEGTNSNGETENHAWNYIQLNNIWYAIDCTWDDPIIIGGFLTNSSKYRYFLKGEDEFNQSHTPIGQFTENGKVFEFPVLSKDNY